ncbi:hypothetical protein H7K33_22420 [Mycobacterium paraense]|uniref:DUF7937 domain-containing protein n=1 Tax=Mycobacterium paraense TaxID=767916 RepID=UPI000A164A40|nr:hypothetical protein [Mycobacterium paraense]ORW39211.1 hypothetical protein AWB89_23690 [Mycobacterium paraense]
MSQTADDAPTGPIRRPGPPPGRRPAAAGSVQAPTRRRNIAGDLTAAALLVLALLLPWNLYFGMGIPGSNKALLAALYVVTLLALLSIALAGSWRASSARFNPALAGRLRLALNAPYALLVLGFIAFDVFETIRFGGTVNVPGGVGPGAWLGIAGALLSARPVVRAADDGGDNGRSVRIIGYASMVGAALSFGFNLFWRVRYALQSAGGSDFGKQNIAVIATALVYGVVALVAVVVGSRWLLRSTRASRLATVALGVSTLIAGIVVWILPVGRDIDAFHGIAQNTSTAGVGFEGYLAWAAAAAIFAPPALLARRDPSATEENAWRAAARNGLLLIIVWCLGSMVMRITDLAVGVALNYPFSRYDSMVLAAFDLTTALLAVWLRINLANDAVSPRLISSLCGLVATLSITRVVVGVALAPRFEESPNAPAPNPVYGNNLAQQITSTFDVALCVLALCILAAAVITGQLGARRARRRRRRPGHARGGPAGTHPGPAAPTTRIPVGRGAPPSAAATTRIPTGGAPQLAGSPRIFRGDDSATRQIPVQKPRIFRPPSG